MVQGKRGAVGPFRGYSVIRARHMIRNALARRDRVQRGRGHEPSAKVFKSLAFALGLQLRSKTWRSQTRAQKKRVLKKKTLETLEILEILENPQTVENKGESDHFPEIPGDFEIPEIPDTPRAKGPLS